MNSLTPQPRLRISAVVVVVGILGGGVALVMYGSLGWLPLPAVPPMPGIADHVPQEMTQLPTAFTKQANQYGGIVLAKEPERPQIVQVMPETPPPVLPAKETGQEEGWMRTLGIEPAPTPQQAAAAQPPPPQARQTPAPKEPPAKKPRWELLAEAPEGQAAGAPQALLAAASPQEGTVGTTQQDGKLIQPARWEIPANPLRTIYRSQTLTCRLLQAINSDIPGQVKCQLTTPVLDKFGYDTEILPKGTLVIAKQEQSVSYGRTRLQIRLEQLELPSGEVVLLKATFGDESGASGLAGKVNNHLGKVILATGLSAILNIGVRSATGTPSAGQFFQNPVQQAGQDIGQSLQRDTQSVIDRELRIPPTVTIPAGTFCTISLEENLQFNRPPLIAK
ncbi:MAG TPA: TrbI/VirB10 family protein [Candidatus Tectomicrobia bacterium]